MDRGRGNRLDQRIGRRGQRLPGTTARRRLFLCERCGATNDAFFDSVSLRPTGAAGVKLNGTVTDDGLPAGGIVSATWSTVSGPGAVMFSNANAAATAATFTVAGSYVLRLTGNDGQLS